MGDPLSFISSSEAKTRNSFQSAVVSLIGEVHDNNTFLFSANMRGGTTILPQRRYATIPAFPRFN